MDEENNSTWLLGLVAVLVGTIFLVWGSYYDGQTLRENSKSFAQALGTAIMLAGAFGILLEWKSTKEYFAKRLSEIVMQDDYLKELSKEKLENLFLSIQKHIFDTDDVKKEGGFLDYFNKHLHGYIVEPYRENVSTEIVFSHLNGSLQVTDKISYICREMNGRIQDYVRIGPDEGEFLTWDFAKITLGAGEEKVVIEKNKEELEVLLNENQAIQETIPEHLKRDCLKVVIEQEYTLELSKLQSWQMSHPTRGLKVSLVYPENLVLEAHPLLQIEDATTVTDELGYYGLVYNEWMLPLSGITWTFREK